MDVRQTLLLVAARMASADGHVSERERAMLEPLLRDGDDLDSLLRESQERSLPELLEGVSGYADRFFIALQAATIALVDDSFEEREKELYERLVRLFAITPTDQEVIARSLAAMRASEAEQPEPRIAELYAQSSFA